MAYAYQEHAHLAVQPQDLVEEHGKSPDAMAAEKYVGTILLARCHSCRPIFFLHAQLKIIKTTYTSSSHKDYTGCLL